ncbi:hypothetical protein ACQEU3_15290 [Spirillospora sp. CA-253888]
MTRPGRLGGESDAVAMRAGTEEPGGDESKIVPRDVPIDEYTELPEGLKEDVGAEERPAAEDDPDRDPPEKAGPAS